MRRESVIAILLVASVFILAGVFTYWRYYQGSLLEGECFVIVIQGGLNPRDLDVVSPMRMYAYAVVENCEVVYEKCEELYKAYNITCELEWNTCRCIENAL